jgi:hypothetical protein
MGAVKQGFVFVRRSYFRTLEFVLATLVLFATSIVILLVGTQPGGADGGGVLVGLLLLAAASGVFLAATIVLHVSFDAVRFVTN